MIFSCVDFFERFQVSFSFFSHSGLAARYRDFSAQKEIKITGSPLAVRFVFAKHFSVECFTFRDDGDVQYTSIGNMRLK